MIEKNMPWSLSNLFCCSLYFASISALQEPTHCSINSLMASDGLLGSNFEVSIIETL